MSVEVKSNSSSSSSASDDDNDDDYESYESIGDTDDDDDHLFNDTTTLLDDSALSTSAENVDMQGELAEVKDEPSDEVFLAQAKKLMANRQESPDDTKDEKDESVMTTRRLKKKKLLSYEQPAGMPSRKDRGQLQAYQKYREQLGRTRPDMVVDRERERALNRIATSGVVQLFNAVASRQEQIKTDLSTVKSEFKKERIRESHRQEGDEFEDKLKKGGKDDVKKTTAKWMSGNIADVLLDKGEEKDQPKKKRRTVTDD